ncbi:MAG: TatD family hydrolase [Flavisolibacter sp.]|nr:TatD family hydrolase [Flavisolibacter sp.]
MELIDTHAHIYLPEFDSDRVSIIEASSKEGISKIIMPAIDSSTHEKQLQVDNDFNFCDSMMGLHPCSVRDDYEVELEIIKEWLQKRSFLAVGEIGLDFYWDRSFEEKQYEAFRKQIELALELKMPIVIHSRNSIEQCIDVVNEYSGLQGIFHCFSGNSSQAKEIIKSGFYLGIGGVVTFKNSGLEKVITEIGLDKVVLETDAPYLAPVPFRGKRNESSYLKYVVEKLAVLTGKEVEEVAKITTSNAVEVFNLK